LIAPNPTSSLPAGGNIGLTTTRSEQGTAYGAQQRRVPTSKDLSAFQASGARKQETGNRYQVPGRHAASMPRAILNPDT